MQIGGGPRRQSMTGRPRLKRSVDGVADRSDRADRRSVLLVSSSRGQRLDPAAQAAALARIEEEGPKHRGRSVDRSIA